MSSKDSRGRRNLRDWLARCRRGERRKLVLVAGAQRADLRQSEAYEAFCEYTGAARMPRSLRSAYRAFRNELANEEKCPF